MTLNVTSPVITDVITSPHHWRLLNTYSSVAYSTLTTEVSNTPSLTSLAGYSNAPVVCVCGEFKICNVLDHSHHLSTTPCIASRNSVFCPNTVHTANGKLRCRSVNIHFKNSIIHFKNYTSCHKVPDNIYVLIYMWRIYNLHYRYCVKESGKHQDYIKESDSVMTEF